MLPSFECNYTFCETLGNKSEKCGRGNDVDSSNSEATQNKPAITPSQVPLLRSLKLNCNSLRALRYELTPGQFRIWRHARRLGRQFAKLPGLDSCHCHNTIGTLKFPCSVLDLTHDCRLSQIYKLIFTKISLWCPS